MSLKDTIEQWSAGIAYAEAGQYDEAVDKWTEMAEPGAKIHFNVASMFLKLGDLENAERNLELSVKKDPHLALSYFQKGCIHLQKSRHSEAMLDFESTMKNLRGNLLIDYKQLGLQYKLYSCEVQYNRAYTLSKMGRAAEAKKELEEAKESAANFSESRHKIILSALENIRTRTPLLPYKLPEKTLLFHPPKNKTEGMKPVNFLGKAKVVSSVVDQDSYVGFVGVQGHKSPSSSPKPPSKASKLPKPEVPPPAPSMKIRPRVSSLSNQNTSFKNSSGIRPPKPDLPPPPFHPDGNVLKENGPPRTSPLKHTKPELNAHRPQSRSPSPKQPSTMTVKVHYSTTRALRLSSTSSYNQLEEAICNKFSVPQGSLTLWSIKKNGDRKEVANEAVYKQVVKNLDDGFRLTLWAYDKHESSPENDAEEVIREMVAIYDYTGQFEDELSFTAGDKIQVTTEINNEWCEGSCNGASGIFPLSFVKAA
ncbi:neutrophil cytosol factor 2-like isoform X2 [Halichondria panicea]|uniref:neutrophil cytosol factor 2-like isoform X2 n=1 Tax=Halichondria panicea TaxID=6063 RepID=UPI00312B5B4E